MDNQLITPDQEQNLLVNTDAKEIEKIVDIFNLNLKKRELLRMGKLSQLQDKITDQMQTRLEKYGDQFSNKDLIDYFKVFQDTLSKSSTDSESMPQIQVNTQVNVYNEDKQLSRESKRRVADAVEMILNQYNVPDEENITEMKFQEVVDDV